MLGLAHLLHPLPLDEFWNTYWGKKALVVKGNADKFPDLFGWDALTGLLNEGQTSPNSVRLVHDKESVPPHEAMYLAKWLKKGATLIVNHIHRADPMVGRLSDSIARDLNSTVNTNCYSSWPVSQGFDLHFDGHDVYVVNVEGRKTWRVFEATIPYPLEHHAKNRGAPPNNVQPYLECVLDVGDVLYIPRGHWHVAVAETPSMHLTLGVQARTGAEFLQWLAARLADNDPELRRELPLARIAELGGEETELFDETVAKFRQRVLETLDQAALKESLLRYAMLSNPARRSFQLPELPDFARTLSAGTLLRTNPDQKAIVRRSAAGPDAVTLVARGRQLDIRGLTEKQIRWIFEQHEPWCPRDVPGCDHGNAVWPTLRTVLEQLFDDDLIRIA